MAAPLQLAAGWSHVKRVGDEPGYFAQASSGARQYEIPVDCRREVCRTKEGWLNKQSEGGMLGKKFQKRWFVLNGHSISYSHNPGMLQRLQRRAGTAASNARFHRMR